MNKTGKVLFVLTLLAGIVIGIVLAANFNLLPTSSADPKGKTIEPSDTLISLQDSFAAISEKVAPAVVNISTTKVIERSQSPFHGDDMFKRFFGDEDMFKRFFPEGPLKTRSLGSGFIVDKDGHILTNNHVVANAEDIEVILKGGSSFAARVIGADEKTDLAVIKIDADRALSAAKLGDSDRLRVGDWAIAIGNPFGLSHTTTLGIISAKHRGQFGMGEFDDFIQTDAAINQGNSGGPLVNVRGEVVGINTFIASGEGLGFAIPSNLARYVMEQLIETGEVVRGWLGIGIQTLTDDLAKEFEVPGGRGVLVGGILEYSPAGKAGVKQGDVIIKFNGKAVETTQQLQQYVVATRVGSKAKLTIIRNGKEKTITVKIGKRPDNIAEVEEGMVDEGGAAEGLGMEVQDISEELAGKLRLDRGEGVVVTSVDSGGPAARAGIGEGDVILELGRKKIKSAADFEKLAKKAKPGDSFTALVMRGRRSHFAVIKVPVKE